MGRVLLAMSVGLSLGLSLAPVVSRATADAVALGFSLVALVAVWRELRREHPPTTHHHHA